MRSLIAAVSLTALLAASGFAQSGAGLGSISGVVQDATGSAVPGAAVIVANDAKGIKRTLQTNNDGQFSAPALTPDAGYAVTVSKSGFGNYDAKGITLTVGQNIDLHVKLSVAATSTQVDVTDTAALLEDTKMDVSQLVSGKEILDLPINGRRVDSFVLMTPAVVPDGTFGLISFRGVAGHNNFLTDGNDTTDQYYNENAGRTRISSQISQDAVQEFQVISDNFAAEYGRAMGGVINTITKSGTNSVHGSSYWFFRNRSLNARDRYASFNPPEWRHQVGASVGGAIIRNKLFYFVNYEKTKRNFPLIASITTANLFNAQGTLVATCGAPATPAQCAAATQMLTTRNFGTIPRTVDQDLAFGKLDYHFNERNTLTLSLNYLRWVSPHGIQTQAVLNDGNGIGNNADSTVRTRYGLARLTSVISSNIVNEARFGWFKDRLFDAASSDFLYPGLGRAGLTVNSTGNLGVATSYPRLNPSEQRFQYADTISVTLGAHSLKAGVDIANTEDYQNQLSNQFGSYSYNTLSLFAADYSGNTTGTKNWTSYSQRFGNPIVDTHVTDLGLFAQDQWRVNSRLVLSYGVRYDYAKIPQPKLVNPDYAQTGIIPSAKDNLAPRIGVSYALTPDRKTLLRIGYGIFYSRYQTGLINTLFINNNIYQKSISYQATTAAQLAAGPVYPNFLSATDFNPPAGTTSITFADKNMRNPYTQQGNLGIEREIVPGLSLNTSYVWSRSVRLYTVRDLNLGPLGAPVTFTYTDASGATKGSYTTPTYRGSRPDPRYQRINQVENGGLAYYDGLVVQLRKTYSHGFQSSVAYTWSHAIDFNQSGGGNNIFFSGSPSSLINGDYAGDKGSSANDTRHRMTINFVWNPTFTKSNTWLARQVINGWQLSQITTLQSSQPLLSTVTISGSAFPGALFTGSINGSGGSSRVPWQPVDNLNLDRIYRVDARIAKIFPINEKVKLYLQFEGFNIFNTPYDTSRRSAEYSLNTATGVFSPIASYGSPSASQGFPDGTNVRRGQVSMRLIF